MLTAPQLFAVAKGVTCPAGPERCFFCGGRCDQTFPASRHRSDTFTGWSTVSAPSSPWCCGGCVAATDEADRSKRPRFFSWVLTPASAVAYGKGDLAGLRSACLSPPAGPYAIAVAVSGQKHLIYRTPVNLSAGVVVAQIEEDRVKYTPAELADRLAICARIAAAAGKPSLVEPPGPSLAIALSAYWTDFEPLIDAWAACWQSPLSRFAAHLSLAMEQAQREYPADVTAAPAGHVRRRRVPPPAAGADGPGLFAGVG